jgi:hypothetical protein
LLINIVIFLPITLLDKNDKKVKAVKENTVNNDLNRKSIRFITVEDVHPIIIIFSAPLNGLTNFNIYLTK